MSRLRFFIPISCVLFFLTFSDRLNNQPYHNTSVDSVVYLPLIMEESANSPTNTPTSISTVPRPTRTKTPTPTRTQTRTFTPFRTSTPLPTSTITPTTTLTPTATYTLTLTSTTTYVPLPEITLIYPTLTPTNTPTKSVTLRPTGTATPAPFFSVSSNQARLGILALVGSVWILLAVWLVILLRRNRADQE